MLSIKNLTKTYEDAAVVDDVTIDLPPGKVISLIGPNGAGKSTVLGMISRLIARTAGIVEFKGRDITHWESRELAKHLAILTQANFVQMKLTVRELVAFGRFPHSGSALSADDWTKVDQAASASAPSLQWCSLRTLSMCCSTNPPTISTSITPRR